MVEDARNADWRSEPRSPRDFVRLLIRRPDLAPTVPLFRSTTFNPRDIELSHADRLAITSMIEGAAEAGAALVAEYEEASNTEFAIARQRGLAVEVDQNTFEGRWAFSQLGADPICRQIDGTTWGAARRDMPASERARGAVDRFGVELVKELIGAFAAAGALNEAEQRTMNATADRLTIR